MENYGVKTINKSLLKQFTRHTSSMPKGYLTNHFCLISYNLGLGCKQHKKEHWSNSTPVYISYTNELLIDLEREGEIFGHLIQFFNMFCTVKRNHSKRHKIGFHSWFVISITK